MNTLNLEYVVALQCFILHNMNFEVFKKKKINWNCLTVKLLVYIQIDVCICHLNNLLIDIYIIFKIRLVILNTNFDQIKIKNTIIDCPTLLIDFKHV